MYYEWAFLDRVQFTGKYFVVPVINIMLDKECITKKEYEIDMNSNNTEWQNTVGLDACVFV